MGRTKSDLMWPTPCVAIARNGCPPHSKRLRRKREQGWTIELHDMASSGMMKGRNWGTPRVTTNGGHPSPQCTGKGSRLEDQVAMENWATPNTLDHLGPRTPEGIERQANGAREGRTKPANLREQVDPVSCEIYKDTNWQTPEARNQKGYHVQKDGSKIEKLGSQAGAGKLNPDWVESLMGLPLNTTQLSKDIGTGKNRIERLRLLGNGVVPQTAAKAFLVLLDEI